IFTPAAVGPRTGALTISHNAPGGAPVVSLTGNGTNPPITTPPPPQISAKKIDFGPVVVGTVSPQQTVVVTGVKDPIIVNGPDLTVSYQATGANAADFSILNPTPGARARSQPRIAAVGGRATLHPGQKLAIDLVFTPTALGVRSAVLEIDTNAG